MAAEEALVAQHKTAKQQTLLRDTTLLWAPWANLMLLTWHQTSLELLGLEVA